jgi:CMP-N-acetylneuraminic acid synthetase
MTRASCHRILGLVPARGGSKGIPRKNLAKVAGKPLLAWTVEAARDSASLERLVVSTEDDEIARVARECGAEVPFMRPAELARDDTPGIEPVLHALQSLRVGGYQPEWVMLLQPTSPLRTSHDIRAAIEISTRAGVDSVISVCEAVPPPAWLKKVRVDGSLENYFSGIEVPAVRQALPSAHALNGAIYLTRLDILLQRRSFYGDRPMACVMPRERSIDIDTGWDLTLADLILQHLVSPET